MRIALLVITGGAAVVVALLLSEPAGAAEGSHPGPGSPSVLDAESRPPLEGLTEPVAGTVTRVATEVPPSSDAIPLVVEPVADTVAPVIEVTSEAVVQPLADRAARVVAPVADTAGPVVAPVAAATAPVVAATAPVTAPVKAAVAPIVTPVVETVTPVVAAGGPAVAPVIDAAAPVPEAAAPVVAPVVDAAAPVVAVVEPVVDRSPSAIVDPLLPSTGTDLDAGPAVHDPTAVPDRHGDQADEVARIETDVVAPFTGSTAQVTDGPTVGVEIPAGSDSAAVVVSSAAFVTLPGAGGSIETIPASAPYDAPTAPSVPASAPVVPSGTGADRTPAGERSFPVLAVLAPVAGAGDLVLRGVTTTGAAALVARAGRVLIFPG